MTTKEPAETKTANVKLMGMSQGKMPRNFMGPLMVDQAIRQAITHCWMILPDDQRTMEKVEKEITRLVQRALKDMKEDGSAFGFSEEKQPQT